MGIWEYMCDTTEPLMLLSVKRVCVRGVSLYLITFKVVKSVVNVFSPLQIPPAQTPSEVWQSKAI